MPAEWLDNLARRGLACYLEPGIWVAAEQREAYETALGAERNAGEQAGRHIVRRLLYYRGGQTAGAVQERYFLADGVSERILYALCASGDVVEDGGVYYCLLYTSNGRGRIVNPS